MARRLWSTIILLFIITVVPPAYSLLLSNENNPSPIDKFLQVVWEPSSLIRMWVGLDQLYNIALSWRTVAKKLISLPFGEDPSSSYIRIQEPRSLMYHKPSVASQLDRFNKMYASSKLSPIVAHAPGRPIYNQKLKVPFSNDLQAESNVHTVFRQQPGSFGLPPLLFFQPQNGFFNQNLMHSSPSGLIQQGYGIPLPFKKMHDEVRISKIADLQKQVIQKPFHIKRHENRFNGFKSPAPSKEFSGTSLLNVGPEEKLNMFLSLLKNLRILHTKSIESFRVAPDLTNNFEPMDGNGVDFRDVLATSDK